MFAAVLDTSVLWPSLQRDFLLSLAVENLYQPLWSEVIVAELRHHEGAKLVKRGSNQLAATAAANRLVSMMTDAFDDAMVVGWEGLEGSYGLPDPDDEHVVAAAVVGGAGAIVTSNVRDFPRNKVPGDIAVLTPAEFATSTVAVNPLIAVRAVIAMSRRRRNPPESVTALLTALESRYRMAAAVDQLRDAMRE